MKIALVHDYLKEYGGAERVLLAFHEIWPEAPIYTIFWRRNSAAGRVFAQAKINQSWFGRIPLADKLISPLRFLIPAIWKSFNFRQYDLVITSASWAITKGLVTGKTKEICYCHTPPRYLYGYETSRKQSRLVKIYGLIVSHFMRQYDFNQAQKVAYFIANSREVQARIKKFYRRESTIIYPPVEMLQSKRVKEQESRNKEYFLAGGRLERPKNFGLIIKACNQLKLPLKVYGTGGQEQYLRSLAGKTIEFLGAIKEDKKWELLTGCQAFIAAANDEDFGITPVEAIAVGRPVIAFRGGGYLETVIVGKTGEFFNQPTVTSLATVLKKFNPKKYKKDDCVVQAQKFSKDRFQREILQFVKKELK